MARTEDAALDAPRIMDQTVRFQKRTGWVAAGDVLGAIGASPCCILPLILFSLGIGGAHIGNLTAFARYQSIFIAITLGFLLIFCP